MTLRSRRAGGVPQRVLDSTIVNVIDCAAKHARPPSWWGWRAKPITFGQPGSSRYTTRSSRLWLDTAAIAATSELIPALRRENREESAMRMPR